MRRMKRTSSGFSVIELMIALLIAAIVLAMGAPSFTEFRKNNRLTGNANDFLGAVQTARTEAIKRQVRVSVCPSADPLAAVPVCAAGDFRGWVAFVDRDQNCQRTGVELQQTDLVRVGGPVDAAVNVKSNGGCITFDSTGFTFVVAGVPSASRVVFCDDRGDATQSGTLSYAREVEIVNVGRSRITREQNDLTVDNGVGPVVGCP